MPTLTADEVASELTMTPIPVHTPGPVAPLPADAPTILLVDDSETQCRYVQRILARSGPWRIVAVGSGADALEHIAATPPDVVVTDLFMPNMDGLALVEQIRSRFPHIPVVVMTGKGNEQLAVGALKAGAADYVPKRELELEAGAVLDRVVTIARTEQEKVRLQSGLTGRVTRFALDNDPQLVPPLVAQFRTDLLDLRLCDQTGATRVGIALEEALLNAIYHGNLEVSSDLRENGDEPFRRLARERRSREPYCTRRVTVSARISPQRATFVVTDEGPGFDVAKLPDPTSPEYLERASGRGLLLMQSFMDEVRYNDVGNRVTLVKRRDAVGSPAE